MKLKVQQGGRDTEVEVAEEAKGIDLKQAVENSLGVFVRNQKLIFKGKIINDAERLSERNIREGCRVLLLSTAAGQATLSNGRAILQQVVKEKAAQERQRREEGPAAGKQQAQPRTASSVPPDSIQARAVTWAKTGVVALRGAALSCLPPAMLHLGPAARVADLEGNALETLPPELGQLSGLQRLRLSYNALTEAGFPDALSRLVSLSVLAADHNRLTRVPAPLLQLTSLRDLSLSHNRLQAVPPGIGSLTGLQRLGLAHNLLETLPDELGLCGSLRVLDAAHNQLASLPQTLCGLGSLRELVLDGNRLQSLPPELLRDCTSLCTLSLHANPITVDELRDTEGFSQYNARRMAKVNKQMDRQVLLGSQSFDEGADVDWQRWA